MSQEKSLGIIAHTNGRRTDYLFRISIKAIIRDENGDVLVVKENGRSWWDLPGGGVDHNETLKSAISRELHEEVSFTGAFDYRIIAVHDPIYLQKHDFWQTLIICEVSPKNHSFSVGEDADAIAFMNPNDFIDSSSPAELRIYRYAA